MAPAIGYERTLERSSSRDVAEDLLRVRARLSRERAERRALQEIADAERRAEPWKLLQRLKRRFLTALASIAEPGDDEVAQAEVQAALRAVRGPAEASIRAALASTRLVMEKKSQVEGHPWFGKSIVFLGQPTLKDEVRADGIQIVVGMWAYEVRP